MLKFKDQTPQEAGESSRVYTTPHPNGEERGPTPHNDPKGKQQEEDEWTKI